MGFGFFKRKGFLEAAVLTALVTFVLMFATWQIASQPTPRGSRHLQSEIDFLAVELTALQERFARIQARNAVLERETDVLRQANRMLREEESVRQAELNRLQSELDFFRRLAGTGGAQEGLDVYRVELVRTDSARVFQVVVTLTQNIRRAAVIDGRLRVEVEGVAGDRPQTLGWSELADGGSLEPEFRFKYFQQLEGYLALPENFGPTRLVLTLDTGSRSRSVRRAYDWSSLLDGDDAPTED